MAEEEEKSNDNLLGKLFDFLEKDRTNVIGVFSLIMIYAFARATVEIFLLAEKNPYTDNIFLSSVHNWVHVLGFFTCVFLLGTLFVSFLAKVRIRKAVNVILWGFWLIIIAPILDYFVFGVRNIEAYYYAPITEIPSNISTYFLYYSTTWGLRILGVIIMGLGTFYVAYRSKSIPRTILTPIALFGVMTLFGSLNFISATGELFQPPPEVIDDFTREVTKPYVGPQLFMFELLFVVAAFLVVVYIDYSNKKIFPFLLRKIKPLFFLYPLVVMGIGLFSARFLDIANASDFSIIGIVMLIGVFGWLFANMLKLYYEPEMGSEKKQRKKRKAPPISKSQLKHSAVVLAIITLGLSFLSGFTPFFLCAVCILLIWMYILVSMKTKNEFLKAIIFGVCSFFGYLLGYFSLTHFERYSFGIYEIWYPATRTTLDSNAINIGLVILLIGIFASILYGKISKTSK